MKGIRIIAKKDGFRRGGIEHHGTREYPVSRFTEQQLKQLRKEPLLVVQDIELPDPPGCFPVAALEKALSSMPPPGQEPESKTEPTPEPTPGPEPEGKKAEKGGKGGKAGDPPPAA